MRLATIPTILATLAILSPLAEMAAAEVVELAPFKDNVIYQEGGGISNGAGDYLFAGRNSLGNRRRALLAFDVAGAVPEGSVIDSVTLNLYVSQVPPIVASVGVDLHRVLANWGEGASDALGPEGMGAPAEAGDATWQNTFFPGSFWAAAGGDFDPVASAGEIVDGIGFVTWGPAAEMTADVQGWLDAPSGNFGWIVVGDGFATQTAKRYNSRTHPDPMRRPRLVVEFTPPFPLDPVEIPAVSAWGMVVMSLLLALAGLWVRRRQAVPVPVRR